MRILFMGTPEFAVPSLERIVADGHELCGVFTQPDRPQGRSFAISRPPVKLAAEGYGVPVFQPESMKDGVAARAIRELAPDAVAVVAFGRILPEEILNIPKLGCINVHASLLPAYRGAAPMQWAIINGEKRTGITTMYMAKGLDTGDIILMDAVDIGENETYGELHDAMKGLGAELLSKTLALLEQGEVPRRPQGDVGASYAPMIDRGATAIDFSKPAKVVHDLVRGLSPAPGATSLLNGKQVKLFGTTLTDETSECAPGSVTGTEGGIRVCCGDGRQIIVTEVQEQGGKKLAAGDYLRGHRAAASGRFGA